MPVPLELRLASHAKGKGIIWIEARSLTAGVPFTPRLLMLTSYPSLASSVGGTRKTSVVNLVLSVVRAYTSQRLDVLLVRQIVRGKPSRFRDVTSRRCAWLWEMLE